jgi:flagellar biosynthesis/type III secretory pathway chaperone
MASLLLPTKKKIFLTMVNLTQSSVDLAKFNWEELLNLLRDELQEYGGLIGLLSAQQQSILNRKEESLLQLNQSVQTQMEASQILQKRRQGMVCSLAKSFGESERSTLSELVPHFPDVTRPMFESIIEEINSLITRVREKVMQNQRLLARLVEVTDQILSATDPAAHSKTYSSQGKPHSLSSVKRSQLSERA